MVQLTMTHSRFILVFLALSGLVHAFHNHAPSTTTRTRACRSISSLPPRRKLYSTQSSNNLVAKQNLVDTERPVQVLSRDPLVYTVPGLLSPTECRALQDYVTHLPPDVRPLTRSNPPEVSLDIAKLWPLSLLSLAAGLPPVMRLYQAAVDAPPDLHHVWAAALPNIIIAAAGSVFLAFGVVLPLARTMAQQSSRTSDAVALNQPTDGDVIRSLVDRVVAQTGHPWTCWEAPVVTRYEAGAIFARHGDASPTRGSEWRDVGGQRVITCICYLQTIPEGSGGETYFDQLGLAVAPVAGTALIFFPADSESWLADERTTHESLPPHREKWIVQMFGRAQRVPPPLGLPDEYSEL